MTSKEALSCRISTLRIPQSSLDALQDLLEIRKQALGLRGHKLTLQDVIRDAIKAYIGEQSPRDNKQLAGLENKLDSILEMKGAILEQASFVKFLKGQADKPRVTAQPKKAGRLI